ncbi:MAG: hypothetical protein KBD51_01425 [Candidatus Levybacteria bacterium]|nr:hypothetical protein [Candidatus Levybacteria bacterium]
MELGKGFYRLIEPGLKAISPIQMRVPLSEGQMQGIGKAQNALNSLNMVTDDARLIDLRAGAARSLAREMRKAGVVNVYSTAPEGVIKRRG